MPALITELIDKQDGFEIVRDKIAAILVLEIANQQILAFADAQDPDKWKLRVFKERSNPWEQYLNDQSDRSPVVNIWYDNSSFPEGKGNIMERQQASGIFNIDVIGFGISSDNGAGGHNPGDQLAALEAQKGLRLVRNILMAAVYSYLDLRGLVGQRWIQTETTFQPQMDSQTVQQIVGARLALRVRFNEFSPQVPFEILEVVHIDVKEKDSGELLLAAEYDYTS